jgi:NADH-quinone oxidoreductase subunit L
MTDPILILIILFLPFLTTIFLLPFIGKNKNLAGFLFSLASFINVILSLYVYVKNYELAKNIYNFSWFQIGNRGFNISILADNYTYLMLILVNFISCLVGLFSIEYLKNDNGRSRYFIFLGLFLFSMIGIIISNNLFQMYFFWELVGFCSYLLIGFWYTKSEAIQASKKAFLMNRIGDLCFLIGILLCFIEFGDVEINNLIFTEKMNKASLTGLLLFGGCIAKSAQFPLHTWLPDAMEGPTPVSALIHAATMVAAGIYLIVRIFPIFNEVALQIISIIGCISMLMAGFKAILQTDIKKVLAYSTISQLGLMVLAVGASAPNLAFNHLIFHAFFKAGLFLSSGSVIHALHKANHSIDAQNMYEMGGLAKLLPITFICHVICALAMVGFPFFSGFISKDAIMEAWFLKKGIFNQLIFVSLLISSLFTATYMARQIWLIYAGSFRNLQINIKLIAEDSLLIKIPIIVLAILSTFLAKYLINLPFPHLGFVPIVGTFISIIGVILVFNFQNRLMRFGAYRSKIDDIYERYFVNTNLELSNKISHFDSIILDGFTKLITLTQLKIASVIKWLDQNLIDGIVNFMATFSNKIGKSFIKIQSGQFQWYVSAMVILLLLVFLLGSYIN